MTRHTTRLLRTGLCGLLPGTGNVIAKSLVSDDGRNVPTLAIPVAIQN